MYVNVTIVWVWPCVGLRGGWKDRVGVAMCRVEGRMEGAGDDGKYLCLWLCKSNISFWRFRTINVNRLL